MIFCQQDTPYKHKVRVKYSHRQGAVEFWKCPDCERVYTIETDAIRESGAKATAAPAATEAKQLRFEL